MSKKQAEIDRSDMKRLLASLQKAGIKPPKPKKGESRHDYFQRLRNAAGRAHERNAPGQAGALAKYLASDQSSNAGARAQSASDRRRMKIGKDGNISR